MTYMLLLNCALKLVEEIILYYDVRSIKHQITKKGKQFNKRLKIYSTKQIGFLIFLNIPYLNTTHVRCLETSTDKDPAT